jgi:hypothetical protein
MAELLKFVRAGTAVAACLLADSPLAQPAGVVQRLVVLTAPQR